MAEISTAGIPEPDGDFGIWGVKNNKKVVQLIEGHNDHDGKIATNAADIAGLTEGVIPELTDAGIAAVLGTDGSASQAEVIAQTEAVVTPLVAGKQDVATLGTDVAAKVTTAGETQTAVDARADIRTRALAPALISTRRPTVINRKNLQRFSDALKLKACPVVTVVGNSIAWGVGADDVSATTSGYFGFYRQFAWPVQVRKRLALLRGQLPAEHFIFLAGNQGYATVGGTAAVSQTIGPFGGFGTDRGGVSLPDSTATVTIDSTKTGRFTDLDVFYWGTAAGVSGGNDPTVLIDGVSVSAGGTPSTGNLMVKTITGLSDGAHTITLAGTGTAPCWVVGVVPRRASGVVVNRIAAPGAQITSVLGPTGWTSQQRSRQRDAAILAGYSDLVVISMLANDVTAQQPLATYTTTLTTLINGAVGAGACVLLMGDPAVANEETYTIPGSAYRQAMIDLSNANGHVAYADFNAIFGERTTAQAAGMWAGLNSVHPSNEGHRRMADFMLNDVLPSASI